MQASIFYFVMKLDHIQVVVLVFIQVKSDYFFLNSEDQT